MFQGTDNTGHCLLTSESSILGTATISKPVGHIRAAVLHRATHGAQNWRGSCTEAFPTICLSQAGNSNSVRTREPQHPSTSPSSSLSGVLSTCMSCWAPCVLAELHQASEGLLLYPMLRACCLNAVWGPWSSLGAVLSYVAASESTWWFNEHSWQGKDGSKAHLSLHPRCTGQRRVLPQALAVFL